jgi:hypothetical protein
MLISSNYKVEVLVLNMPIFSKIKSKNIGNNSKFNFKSDSTPKQLKLGSLQDGLSKRLAEHKLGEGKIFEDIILEKTNPLSDEQMNNVLANLDLKLLAKEGKDTSEEFELRGPCTIIKFTELVKEKHKKRKYIGIPQLLMVYRPTISFSSKYHRVYIEMIDNRFEEEDEIRSDDFASNIPQRIVMGFESSIKEDELGEMSLRITTGLKKEVRWGVLTIIPHVIFTRTQTSFPYIKTFSKALMSEDLLKMLKDERDPARFTTWMEHQDYGVVAQIYQEGELRDESKPDVEGEDREKYYGGTVFDKGPKKDINRKSAIKNWNKEAQKEWERSKDNIEVDDNDSTTSSKLREQVLNENNDNEEETNNDKEKEIIPNKKEKNTVKFKSPTPSTNEDIKGKKRANIEEENEQIGENSKSTERVRSPPPSYDTPFTRAVSFNRKSVFQRKNTNEEE